MTTPTTFRTVAREEARFDAGLRRHMLQVYNYMASAVMLTGIVALICSSTGITDALFGANGKANLLGWIAILAPLAYVFILRKAVQDSSLVVAQTTFWSFAMVMGVSMSTIFLQYTGTSIATTFVATSAAFAGLSLWGYTTRRDLGPIGGFLLMSLWGLIAAILVNMLFRSEPMDYLISAAGIVIFAGLTAYDTQKIKSDYLRSHSAGYAERLAIWGALELYLDFVNLMLHLLRFMGAKKD